LAAQFEAVRANKKLSKKVPVEEEEEREGMIVVYAGSLGQ
jgi:hypothetical protein